MTELLHVWNSLVDFITQNLLFTTLLLSFHNLICKMYSICFPCTCRTIFTPELILSTEEWSMSLKICLTCNIIRSFKLAKLRLGKRVGYFVENARLFMRFLVKFCAKHLTHAIPYEKLRHSCIKTIDFKLLEIGNKEV